MAFRVLKLLGGLVLIVVGVGLFVLFTAAINKARSMGPPMNIAPFSRWQVVLVLDLVFLSLVFGGVRLARFGWSVFGWIIVVTGIGVLGVGIWNHIDGPPIDYDSTRSDNRMYVAPALNGIVYVWAGLTMLGGLFLAALATRARRD